MTEMFTTKIVEKETGEVIAEVRTNHSLSFDDACELAGLEWLTFPQVDTEGWYKAGILWDQEVAELVTA